MEADQLLCLALPPCAIRPRPTGKGNLERWFWLPLFSPCHCAGSTGVPPARLASPTCGPGVQAVTDVLCPLLERRYGAVGAGLVASLQAQLQAIERDVLEVRSPRSR